ncbi:hypothetical protein JZ751_026417 [Albula glossodonta]|uniref:Uncharacterized protein n=1 Tax=Albula glossodonta TaxID=121402 RepID=A0A8T2PBX7_9TELE|nr:hypothetical protein JZ751_026417 [Albula glossodonta]
MVLLVCVGLLNEAEAEEDGDANQGDGGWSSKELSVVNAEVPDHGQHHHKDGHHKAACVKCQAHPSGAPAHSNSSMLHLSGPRHRSGRPLSAALPQGLGNVAVDDTVVGDVERQQCPPRVLQQLALEDEFDLPFLTRKVFAAETERGNIHKLSGSLDCGERTLPVVTAVLFRRPWMFSSWSTLAPEAPSPSPVASPPSGPRSSSSGLSSWEWEAGCASVTSGLEGPPMYASPPPNPMSETWAPAVRMVPRMWSPRSATWVESQARISAKANSTAPPATVTSSPTPSNMVSAHTAIPALYLQTGWYTS